MLKSRQLIHRGSNMRFTGAFMFAAFASSCLAASVTAQNDPIVGPQVRIDVGGGTAASNETSAAVSAIDPNDIVCTWNDWRAGTPNNEIIRMGVACSIDGGLTWTDFLIRPPAPNQSAVEGDPMSCFDNRTGTLWVGAISFDNNGGLFVARKDRGATTFQPSVQIGQQFFADKCWMAAGPPPGNPNATNLYIADNEGLYRSTDMGAHWAHTANFPSGIGFLPRIGPNGEVYVSYWDFDDGMMILRSLDGGSSFGSPIRVATRMDVWGTQDGSRFVGNFRCPPMATMAVDQKTGAIYYAYADTTNIVNGDRNVDIYFTTSIDQGAHWTTPGVINFDNNPPGDQFFPWLEVDAAGRIHCMYHDSRNVNQHDNVTHGFLDVYYSYSDDGGATWYESRLTPDSFDCDNDGLNRSQQFIGDYNGMAVGGNRAYPCYISTQNGDSDIFINAIGRTTGLTLSGPVPGIAGQNSILKVVNAAPGARVALVYSLTDGTTGVPNCPGVTVGMTSPKVLTFRNSDNNGRINLTMGVPQAAAGRTVLMQAVEPANCKVSNLLRYTFPQ